MQDAPDNMLHGNHQLRLTPFPSGNFSRLGAWDCYGAGSGTRFFNAILKTLNMLVFGVWDAPDNMMDGEREKDNIRLGKIPCKR